MRRQSCLVMNLVLHRIGYKNIGQEEQKSGIKENELDEFCEYCKKLKLNVIGLMCIPPFDEDSSKYFIHMKKLSKKFGFKELSMGMSADYTDAIQYGATFVRIGSSIFGLRSQQ